MPLQFLNLFQYSWENLILYSILLYLSNFLWVFKTCLKYNLLLTQVSSHEKWIEIWPCDNSVDISFIYSNVFLNVWVNNISYFYVDRIHFRMAMLRVKSQFDKTNSFCISRRIIIYHLADECWHDRVDHWRPKGRPYSSRKYR